MVAGAWRHKVNEQNMRTYEDPFTHINLISIRRNRRTGKNEFVSNVNKILMTLAPSSTFNPTIAWDSAKKKEAEAEAKAAEEAAAELKASKQKKGKEKEKEKMKAGEKIQEKNIAEKARENFVKEVTRIRNTKSNLKSLLREISNLDARRVLIVEILKRALDDNNREALFEALWAVDEVGLSEFNAPQPANVRELIVPIKQSDLVYDDYSKTLACLKKARAIMDKEADMIRVQLVDMSDCLPPLSKFTFGFSLDPWQKRVLKWIDAGRSVLICAPTSSGKTVLSSYVAFIASKVVGPAAERKPVSDKPATGNGDNDKYDDEGVDDDDEEGEEGGDDDEEEEEDEDDRGDRVPRSAQTLTPATCRADRLARAQLRKSAMSAVNAKPRVLFVVPTEPLVWQVGAYFSKLLREEGDEDTKVAIVSDKLVYHPVRKLNVMPQIVVGTPFALENALTKSRGLCGQEVYGKTVQITLPGGFDHFDWVIYDEVHSLDGEEGAALQRLIRSMSCKFLALSATVGNSEQLRGWMEGVKGEQLDGVETIDVITDESVLPAPPSREVRDPIGTPLKLSIKLTCGGATFTIASLGELSTVGQLKQAIALRCPALPALQQQLTVNGCDLSNDKAILAACGVTATSAVEGLIAVIANTHVNLLFHQGRFINLQRFVWKNGVLADLSPLGAVESIADLQGGILDNSSLSFTSKDSFKLWKKLEELYPADAVAHISPYSFFKKDERITLQRTKDYEDLLKTELRTLSVTYPNETQELLYAFRLDDPPKEFDICELVLSLKEKDMLPCLPFHLNAFEAIRLFQGLVAGLEWRQKRAHPTYYSDLHKEKEAKRKQIASMEKNAGRNDKQKEEEEKSGDIPTDEDLTVNEWAPHPAYTFSKSPLSEKEFLDIADELERFDGFEKRDQQAMKDRPGCNEKVLSHALMRGLRRGVGLFLEEVAFPYYRRAVMHLASQGKLGVIISDDSLAFGVNMPFRTCVFCGEMFDKETKVPRLTPLMAQQMSGRAGRRGLDTQGNLVYAGSRSSFIRRLMIGEVSNTTGTAYPPRYPTLFLQTMLSPRHVGLGRVDTIGRRTLAEFATGAPEEEAFALQGSRQCMVDLKFIKEEDGQWVPNDDYEIDYPLLSMIWELRKTPQESITIGRLLPELVAEFKPLTALISETKRDKVEGVVFHFFACLLVLIGRCPAIPGGNVLHQNNFFLQGERQNSYLKWSKLFSEIQADCPEHLRDPCPPMADGSPTALDGTLFACLLDRNFVHTLTDDGKQTIKRKLWHLGEVLQSVHNALWVSNTYYSVLTLITRNAFKKIQYVNTELLGAVIDFDNVSSAARETRTDAETAVPVPEKAKAWSDCSVQEGSEIKPNSWAVAVGALDSVHLFPFLAVSVSLYYSHDLIFYHYFFSQTGAASERITKNHPTAATATAPEIAKIQRIFAALQPTDCDLVKLLAFFKEDEVHTAVSSCSYSRTSGQHMIGALVWYCVQIRPAVLKRFPLYLKQMYDSDKIDEAVLLEWHKAANAASLKFLPEGCTTGETEMKQVKESCNAFMTWLAEADDDDDDEDEEED